MPLYPRRKHLPHETPLGLPSEDATFFLTICAKRRGTDELTANHHGEALMEAVRHRHANAIWWCRVFLVMPDHIHALLRFPQPDRPLTKVVPDFKKYTARTIGIFWQKDFFDHRLRHDESEREKADYILHNPVRAGLVKSWEQWPYVFIALDAI